jgi:REP element-mobilizing transposase RayT
MGEREVRPYGIMKRAGKIRPYENDFLGEHKVRPYKKCNIMKYNPEIHHRRSIRLKEYDYSQMGAYFITICTHNRQCLFGMITNNELHLNEQGKMIYNYWQKLTTGFSHIQLDEFVVMPNHLHGIVFIGEENDNICRGESCIRPQIINENIMGEHPAKAGFAPTEFETGGATSPLHY